MAASTPTPGIPTHLGHYHILEKIGAGGMGEVYRAHDEHLNRDVAIKLLPTGRLADELARQRFRKEAVSLSKLNHPNIATIHDFDTDLGCDFLVMEYVAGSTLSDRIQRGPLSEHEVVQLGIQLAEGLAAAHEQGVIHRDLKPANVRVTADGRAKILDFGLAKLVDRSSPFGSTNSTQSLTESEAIAGTLPYMAPEQLCGHPCDERSDIYSLGALLYELATGRRPFTEPQGGELVDAILHRDAKPAREFNPKVSFAMEATIGRALEKNPDRRQQSARELLAQLNVLAAPDSTTATKTRWLPWLAWRMRRRYRAFLVSATSMLLLALLVTSWFSVRTPALAFGARDFVLISDFDNQTGDTVFDKSLTTAFTTSLGQSSYANVYSRQRIAEALKRMKKPATDRIDEPLAQELAVREGLKVIVLPSISGVGENYRLAASIRDVNSGKDVRTEFVKVKGKARVLDAVDELSTAIRKDLGESLQAVSQARRLSSVTTQSLPALRQYSIATEKSRALQWDEAKVYYENALSIDPGFTAARAALGVLHIEQATNNMPHFDGEEGKRLLVEAVKHVDGLTDREKYSILAFHARAVERNPGKAIGYLKTLITLYPDDSIYHVNLGRMYTQMGRLPEALAEYKEAARIEPKSVLSYGNLGAMYLYQMGNVAAAMPMFQKMLELDPGNAWAQDSLGWSYMAMGELPLAQAAFEKAVASNPQGTLSRYRLAHAHRLQGHYAQAIETLQQIQTVDPSAISVLYDMGVVYDRMGDRRKAHECFTRYRGEVESRWKKTLHEPGTQLVLSAASVRLGETDRARQLLRKAMAQAPQLHLEAALVLSLLEEKKEAVDQLESAIQNGYTNYIWLKVHPDLLPLHGYPPYEQLIGKMLKL